MTSTIYLSTFAVLPSGEAPDVSFVPPLVRRRLSPLQKIYFALAHAAETIPVASSVFATRDGEYAFTRRIVTAFNEDGSVSPHLFSASVYNAAPGLWSVFTKNRAPYTSIAADADTIECGLLESLKGRTSTLFVYAEETNGGYGAAVLFSRTAGARRLVVSPGDASRPPLTFQALSDFLSGASHRLAGRWVTLCDGE